MHSHNIKEQSSSLLNLPFTILITCHTMQKEINANMLSFPLSIPPPFQRPFTIFSHLFKHTYIYASYIHTYKVLPNYQNLVPQNRKYTSRPIEIQAQTNPSPNNWYNLKSRVFDVEDKLARRSNSLQECNMAYSEYRLVTLCMYAGEMWSSIY